MSFLRTRESRLGKMRRRLVWIPACAGMKCAKVRRFRLSATCPGEAAREDFAARCPYAHDHPAPGRRLPGAAEGQTDIAIRPGDIFCFNSFVAKVSQARTNQVRLSTRDARRGRCPIIHSSAHFAARKASNLMLGLFGISILNPGGFRKHSTRRGARLAMAKPLLGKSNL